MRRKGKLLIWPQYFNVSYTRSKGRKIKKDLAIRNPNVEDIFKAALELGMEPVIKEKVAHPQRPWIKTGMVLVEANFPKTIVIQDIARKMRKIM